MFDNGLGDRGSIPGHIISKTQKMVFDTALLCTRYNKVRIKRKVEQPWEWSSTPPCFGGARGVVVIVVGNEHGDSSSNPGRD